ncbi:hypothetical protein [Rubellimicrobium aerolatum]|uniref:Uncharacterized protein n=1 Tax=Rubellimicrobium aerolatum TaxID=490979 RepID=A0ABW0SH97_9RHOB|nr:hypothetical protein [Rubellimicrobium aerolatum]MBP1807680.1 hypothetical protein [Rubellimicrobium aerolatum]
MPTALPEPFVVRPGRIRRAARRMAEERRAATRAALARLREDARFGSAEEVRLSLRRL